MTTRTAVFRPGEPWRDTTGTLIEAHTGGMLRHDGCYYWIGADWQGSDWFGGFVAYRSLDLTHWTRLGTALEPSSQLPVHHEIARPKIIYHASSGTFVMWFKRKDRTAPGNDVRPGVAVATSPEGPYTFVGDFYPGRPAYNAADFCLWTEPDGAAYYVASCPQQRGGPSDRRIVIFRITDDYRGVEPEPILVGPPDHREAPAVFCHQGRYFLITSGTTGWEHNQAAYRAAPALQGPWSSLQPLGDGTTYDSQPDFVLSVAGTHETTHVYCGGRHVGNALRESTYVWLPLVVHNDTLTLEPPDLWSLELEVSRPPDVVRHGPARDETDASRPTTAF